MYKIRGADGNEYGPIDRQQVLQWLREGRLNSASLAQVEGSAEWKPISAYPEFAGMAPTPATPPPLTQASSPTVTPTRTSALAITSFVLVVTGFCTAGVGIVVGLVLGIIALVKINNSQGRLRGRGLAIAAICIGAVSFLLLPALLLPAFAKAKARGESISCVNNMKQIGLAFLTYANTHGDRFPEDFTALTNELPNPKVLFCRSDRTTSDLKKDDWANLSTQAISYELLERNQSATGPARPLVRCPIHGHMGYTDGSVQRQLGLPRR